MKDSNLLMHSYLNLVLSCFFIVTLIVGRNHCFIMWILYAQTLLVIRVKECEPWAWLYMTFYVKLEVHIS